MRAVTPLLLFFGLLPFTWAQTTQVDYARVTIEKRGGADWCVLDSQVTGQLAVPLERLLGVVRDYPSYPALFPRIKEARVEVVPGAILLSETVQISALGIVNTNRFTLRIVDERGTSPTVARLVWTQESTDGTIDSLEGGWTFESVGSPSQPLVKATYRTKSAVPVKVLGQEMLIRMFLGNETRDVVDAVFKKALSR